MAERARDNKTRSPEREKPRRGGGLRRALALLLFLAALGGAVWFFSSRNGTEALRQRFSYNKTLTGTDSRAELYRYDNDRTNRFALLGDRLLVASTTRVQLLAPGGSEVWSRTVSFTQPGVALGNQYAAVYDVGGTTLLLLGSAGLVRDMSAVTETGILSVSLNASDYLALTTLKSGYRSAVSVYDPAGEPVFTFNSADRYAVNACVLPDNRHLAAVTLGEAEGAFASILMRFALDSEKAESSTTLNGSLVLELGNMGMQLSALEDDRITVFNADGTLSGSTRFGYPYLRGYALGSDFAVLLLSRYRSGSAMQLVSVGTDGAAVASLDLRREVLDVSAAGRYIAVLFADSLTVYTRELEEYAVLEGTDYAKRAVVRDDGTTLLLGSAHAWLFVPS